MTWTTYVKPDHIFIDCEGEIEIEVAKKDAAEAYAMAARHNLDKVLIDWRKLTGSVTDTDRYEVGKAVAEAYVRQKPIRYVKVAVLGRSPIISDIRLGETVARNRGAHGIVTTVPAEAWAYLELPGSPDDLDD